MIRRPEITKKGPRVEFDLASIDVIIVPQYIADPYRLISISKVTPEIRPIADEWKEVPYPYRSTYRGWDYWRKKRPIDMTRMLRINVSGTVPLRNVVLVFSLEPGVDAGELPKQWPTYYVG
jgi:hypothetical protein